MAQFIIIVHLLLSLYPRLNDWSRKDTVLTSESIICTSDPQMSSECRSKSNRGCRLQEQDTQTPFSQFFQIGSMMKTFSVLTSSLLCVLAQSFTTTTLPNSRVSQVVSYGYVPSGLTPEQYKKLKEAEAKKNAKKKNLGGLGPKGFKSRSFQSFQEALERGEAEHLLPVFNAKERVRRGELKEEDIPVSSGAS